MLADPLNVLLSVLYFVHCFTNNIYQWHKDFYGGGESLLAVKEIHDPQRKSKIEEYQNCIYKKLNLDSLILYQYIKNYDIFVCIKF